MKESSGGRVCRGIPRRCGFTHYTLHCLICSLCEFLKICFCLWTYIFLAFPAGKWKHQPHSHLPKAAPKCCWLCMQLWQQGTGRTEQRRAAHCQGAEMSSSLLVYVGDPKSRWLCCIWEGGLMVSVVPAAMVEGRKAQRCPSRVPPCHQEPRSSKFRSSRVFCRPCHLLCQER